MDPYSAMGHDTYTNTKVTVLYGSETGNAEDLALYLGKKLEYLQLRPKVASLDEYPLKNLVTETEYLIIVCSTTGQGDVPRNGSKFMKFILRRKLPGDLLNHIQMTTLGLGDSSYPKFNYAIKKIHARLLQLGCQELSPRCEADEQSPEGIDGYYKEWEDQLVVSLKSHFPSLTELDDHILLPSKNPVEVLEHQAEIDTGSTQEISLTRTSNSSDLKVGGICLNQRVTSDDHFQDVRHVSIKSHQLITYSPGDTIALYPYNDAESVDLLLRSQPHWKSIADKPISIQGNLPNIEGGLITDQFLTLRSLFTHHLDIMSIPRRSFFMVLWHFSDPSTEDGAREQEKLRDFSRFEESEELYNYANRPRRSILETILEFQQNLKIPIEYIFDLFPVIKPRFFSIASKPSPNTVEIVVAIVEYKTIIRRIRRGLCTKWLKRLEEGDRIVFSLQKCKLKFNDSNNYPPIIMVAPGTGVAPMKSLIEDICHSISDQEMYLFYGCRYQNKDYLFKNLWASLTSSPSGKFKVFPCFSRDGDPKIKYVQHMLFAQSSLVGDLLLNRNAIVYVCGSSGSMPQQVRITLVKILKTYSDLEQTGAEKYLLDMENGGRYIQETW